MMRLLLKWLVSRIVRLATRELWCSHIWRSLGVEEIGEEFRYRIHAQCERCGKTRFFPEN